MFRGTKGFRTKTIKVLLISNYNDNKNKNIRITGNLIKNLEFLKVRLRLVAIIIIMNL